MLQRLAARLKKWERKLDKSYGYDFSTPRGRKLAWRHYLWLDHGILRTFWTNFHEIAPGVWRSNHPSPKRLQYFHEMGIKTVLNLRGPNLRSHYRFEKEACDRLGMTMIDLALNARALAPPAKLLTLLDTFETLDAPFVMHCKSGADRAGLASALYLLHMLDVPAAEAKKQLSLRFIHVRSFKTGILDHMLDAYEADTSEMKMPIREWIRTRYDPKILTEEFKKMRGLS